MSGKIVEIVDLGHLPPLTQDQKAEIAALAALSDEDIDPGDIPPMPDAAWAGALRGRFYKPSRTSTTLRIDSDVLAWLQGQDEDYQSRINAILRREMLSALKG